MKKDAIEHDTALFRALMESCRAIDPQVRAGIMFGCPGVFHGRRMAACVYGEAIALRIPQEAAQGAIDGDRAVRFQPGGRPPMREWIALSCPADALGSVEDLLAVAVRYAEINNE
ncbi:MAG: hypothetical protein IPK20_17705 [Betaproteobacteria bacterium]|nr:hypothetical protein [Betaproteobacteria bacterium]